MTEPDPVESAGDALFHRVIRHFLETPPRNGSGKRAPAEPPRSPDDEI